jgi:hypothetical protein
VLTIKTAPFFCVCPVYVEYEIYYAPVHVGYVVDEVKLGQVFLAVLPSFHACIIPQMLYTFSFIYRRQYIVLAIDGIAVKNDHSCGKHR